MKGVHRVEAMLDAALYDAWQEYLQHHRRTGQREIRWLIERAVEEYYLDNARQRRIDALARDAEEKANATRG